MVCHDVEVAPLRKERHLFVWRPEFHGHIRPHMVHKPVDQGALLASNNCVVELIHAEPRMSVGAYSVTRHTLL